MTWLDWCGPTGDGRLHQISHADAVTKADRWLVPK